MLKRFTRRFPILAGVLAALLFLIAVRVGGMLVYMTIPDDGSYYTTMMAELFAALCAVGLLALFGRLKVLTNAKCGFFSALKPCLILLAMLAANLVLAIISCIGEQLNPPIDILVFCMTMLLIGITEEFVFRGIVADAIFEKYGKDGAGVWFSAIVSGVIFGLVHFNNLLSVMELSGVLIQVVMAAVIGTVYSAIYFRTGNIWAMAALHTLNDFTAMFATGLFSVGSMAETVNSYSLSTYYGIIVYSALLLLILRPPKLREMVGEGTISSEGSVRRLCKTLCAVSAAVIICIAVSTVQAFA